MRLAVKSGPGTVHWETPVLASTRSSQLNSSVLTFEAVTIISEAKMLQHVLSGSLRAWYKHNVHAVKRVGINNGNKNFDI